MVRKRYEIHVWGTVLFLDLGSSKVNEAVIDAAVEDVKDAPVTPEIFADCASKVRWRKTGTDICVQRSLRPEGA